MPVVGLLALSVPFLFTNLLETNLLLISLLGVLLNIIDTSDGEIARYLMLSSRKGQYLDKICHYFANTAILFSFSLSFAIHQYLIISFLFAFIAILETFDSSIKDNVWIVTDSKPHQLKSELVCVIITQVFWFN